MTKSMTVRVFTVAAFLALGMSAGAAQQPAAQPAKAVIPVRVDVVLSRFDGDNKKTSSLPFSLYVNINEVRGSQNFGIDFATRTSVRMGVDVPVGSVTSTSTQGVTTTKPEYRSVGTNIDCGGVTLDDGRFKLALSITDSSIFTSDQNSRILPKVADPSAFRQFSTSNIVTLKDGQTLQFATATDKITGEILKVDVTVTTIK
jgi:hypothetical protein